VERRRLEGLPESLLPLAFAFLHRLVGLPYPPRARTGQELMRQLRLPSPVGCDGGQGWRWQEEGGWLILARKPTFVPPETPYFTYTLKIPGELEISEISRRFRITRRTVSPWMRSGEGDRVGVALPLVPGDWVTIRNRRPGDRLRPQGRTHERKLKDLLIDRRWPREARDRIPLLCVGDDIVWVPGLTIDHRYRLTRAHTLAWAAELEVP
jgi:tRNA(Ile)-lysidine synthetase-like protein